MDYEEIKKGMFCYEIYWSVISVVILDILKKIVELGLSKIKRNKMMRKWIRI